MVHLGLQASSLIFLVLRSMLVHWTLSSVAAQTLAVRVSNMFLFLQKLGRLHLSLGPVPCEPSSFTAQKRLRVRTQSHLLRRCEQHAPAHISQSTAEIPMNTVCAIQPPARLHEANAHIFLPAKLRSLHLLQVRMVTSTTWRTSFFGRMRVVRPCWGGLLGEELCW